MNHARNLSPHLRAHLRMMERLNAVRAALACQAYPNSFVMNEITREIKALHAMLVPDSPKPAPQRPRWFKRTGRSAQLPERPERGARTMSNTIDPRPHLERWIRWAHGARHYERSITGKLMDGMGTKTCRTCAGRGRVEGWKVGSEHAWVDPCPTCNGDKVTKSGELSADSRTMSMQCDQCERDAHGNPTGEWGGATCFKCRGTTVVTIEFLYVNPAGIRTTRYTGANEDDDPVSAMIDRTIASWTQDPKIAVLADVIWIEYAYNWTQSVKAREFRRSQAWYSRKLDAAHDLIEQALLD